MPVTDFPASLRRFVELFNAGRYWDSHEVLETPWREAGSPFYQGLILLASAFVHVERQNRHGQAAQARKARARLTPYAPVYLGLDVDAILDVSARLEASATGDGAVAAPVLRLDPARCRGDEPELVTG